MTRKNILCEEIKKEKNKDVTKVVIENWPKTNYFSVYIPIIIAIIVLSISLYSIFLTRKIFVESHRPYVTASSYAFIDHDKNTIIPVPSKVRFCVINSPARIIRAQVKINLNMETLLVSPPKENFVKIPLEESEWSFEFYKEDFDKIMDRPNEDKSKLVRLISVEYSSLDGGKIYHFKLKQSFIPIANRWIDIEEEAE
jgi:hypothetical protein